MRFSVSAASAVLLSNASLTSVNAFGPSASSYTQRPRTSTTRLSLDPASALESASVLTSAGDLVDSLGQLALIGSVGLGVAFSNKNNKDWSYEYKVGNELSEGGSDLALMEESPDAVLEKVEEGVPAQTTPSQKAFFGIEKNKVEPPAPVVTAEPAKATAPSKKLLESTEMAKAEVQKVGVKETKEKMDSKLGGTPPPAEKKEEAAVAVASTEVKETKKPGTKRKILKGVTLIVAAGVIAVTRNLVKAYLGRGML